MVYDLLHNLENNTALTPAALAGGANLTAYVDAQNIALPVTAMIHVGALGGESVTVTNVKVADDAAGTNAVNLAAGSIRTPAGVDLVIDVDGEFLMIEFGTSKRFVAVELTPSSGTPIAGVVIGGQKER